MARHHEVHRCRRELRMLLVITALAAAAIPVFTAPADAAEAAPGPQATGDPVTFALAPFAQDPFKRAPFKRAPFKRAPFKRGGEVSPYTGQVVPTSVARAGATSSPTAAIDGIDEPLDVDIAVLDGGVDATHPDLVVAGSVDCTGPVAGIDRARAPDVDGHGTMVAGLAAARDDARGIVGVAPGARIWSVRVARPDGTITESAARCGLRWLVDHATDVDVAIMSWSGTGAPSRDCGMLPAPAPTRDRRGVDPADEPQLHQLACQARDAGVVLVAAAGNDAADTAHVVPAAWEPVIAVSAFADSDGLPGGLGGEVCDSGELDDHLASFSNFGAAVELAAAGVCVTSTDARGGYAIGSGTSFAAPIVAGAAALLLAGDPSLSPTEVRARLSSSAAPGPLPGDPDGHPEGVVSVAGL